MRTAIALMVLPVLLAGCVKDRDIAPKSIPSGSDSIVPGILKVNEFVATNSINANEFGDASDWFELYNTDAQVLVLTAGEWSVTDGGDAQAGKYVLPELTIPAHGFLVIWCDGLNTVGTAIHTNFSLSSTGEEIAVHHLENGDYVRIDGYAYDDQSTGEHANGESTGRSPDGGDQWVVFPSPTPGASNP